MVIIPKKFMLIKPLNKMLPSRFLVRPLLTVVLIKFLALLRIQFQMKAILARRHRILIEFLADNLRHLFADLGE